MEARSPSAPMRGALHGFQAIHRRGATRFRFASSWLDVRDGWLTRRQSESLLELVLREVSWEQREVIIFGRSVLQPRLIAWYGAVPYRYSGLTLEPRATPPWLGEVLRRTVEATGVELNHVLLNRYRDGGDGMGLHADDERELGQRPVVATLSLGATRGFVVKARGGPERLRLELSAGTLAVMGGASQHELVHGVPKTRRAVGERVSLTFRRVET